jgi:hypothetical protein
VQNYINSKVNFLCQSGLSVNNKDNNIQSFILTNRFKGKKSEKVISDSSLNELYNDYLFLSNILKEKENAITFNLNLI